jgi:hypothetical protein
MLGTNFIGAKNEELRAGGDLLRLGHADFADDTAIGRLDRIGTICRREDKLTAHRLRDLNDDGPNERDSEH